MITSSSSKGWLLISFPTSQYSFAKLLTLLWSAWSLSHSSRWSLLTTQNTIIRVKRTTMKRFKWAANQLCLIPRQKLVTTSFMGLLFLLCHKSSIFLHSLLLPWTCASFKNSSFVLFYTCFLNDSMVSCFILNCCIVPFLVSRSTFLFPAITHVKRYALKEHSVS